MPQRTITASRRVLAIVAGLSQACVGLVLLIVSVDSFGLVGDDDFSFNWVVWPAALVLASIGLTVAFVTGRERWLAVGLGVVALGALIIYPASIMLGNVFLGFLVVVAVQLLPAVWR